VKIEEIDDGLSQAAYQAITWSQTPAGRLNLTEPQFARFEYNGQAYHTMFTPFLNQQWPWLIGVFVPESDYLGAIKDNRNHNILLTLGLSVVATLIGLLLSRTVIRSLAGLEAEALAIQSGDLDSRFETRSLFKEIQLTADAFTRMKSDIRAGEEKYREIFENIQDVYYEASISGRILEVSPSVEKVSSYKREELIGMSLDLLYQNPADRERLLEQLDAHGKVTDFELILTGQHGKTEYCSINACPETQPFRRTGEDYRIHAGDHPPQVSGSGTAALPAAPGGPCPGAHPRPGREQPSPAVQRGEISFHHREHGKRLL
jgi:two-component system cell cycle sensor histidine kinase/response regulator CckA